MVMSKKGHVKNGPCQKMGMSKMRMSKKGHVKKESYQNACQKMGHVKKGHVKKWACQKMCMSKKESYQNTCQKGACHKLGMSKNSCMLHTLANSIFIVRFSMFGSIWKPWNCSLAVSASFLVPNDKNATGPCCCWPGSLFTRVNRHGCFKMTPSYPKKDKKLLTDLVHR